MNQARVQIRAADIGKMIAEQIGVPPGAIRAFKQSDSFSATYVAAPELVSDGAVQGRVETLLRDLRRRYVVVD